jgi:hypothetical protein
VLEGGYGIDAQSRFSLSRVCCAHVAALTQVEATSPSHARMWGTEQRRRRSMVR